MSNPEKTLNYNGFINGNLRITRKIGQVNILLILNN